MGGREDGRMGGWEAVRLQGWEEEAARLGGWQAGRMEKRRRAFGGELFGGELFGGERYRARQGAGASWTKRRPWALWEAAGVARDGFLPSFLLSFLPSFLFMIIYQAATKVFI